MHRSFVAWVAPVALSLGCSSSSFSIADMGDDGGADTGTTGDTGAAEVNGEGGVDSGGIVDTGPFAESGVGEVGPPPGCVPPTGATTDFYVDGSYVGPTFYGTATCPWKDIATALGYVGTPSTRKTVHVKGGTASSPITYAEITNLLVRNNVTLVGDGSTTTRIAAAGGACGSVSCTVSIDHGGVVDGFGIAAGGTRHAVVMAFGYATGGLAAATIRNAVVSGATGDGNFGILAQGSADLGPGLLVTGNARHGLVSWGSGELHVIASGSPNGFNGNGMDGVRIEGSAHLSFEGGTASNNTNNGIRLVGTAPSGGTPHLIQSLTARSNGSVGLNVASGLSVVVRSSTFLKNRYGLVYVQAPVGGGQLDLGTSAGSGNNQFGSGTTTERNTNAGVCIEASRPDSIPAHGDRWSSCSPSFTQQQVAACDGGPTYADVWYHPATAGTPLFAPACTVGP